MSDNTDERAFARLAALAGEAVETQTRLGREYVELVRTSLTSGTDRAAAGRAYLDSARRESERYWRGLSSLGLSYAADVVALGSRTGKAVVRDVRASVRASVPTSDHRDDAATTGEAGAPATSEVVLSGPLGAQLTGAVTVANKHPRARRIALRPGPLLAADGHEVPAVIDASPASVTVPAGDEAEIGLGVHLDPDVFIRGARYTAAIEVSGGAEATLALVVRVEP